MGSLFFFFDNDMTEVDYIVCHRNFWHEQLSTALCSQLHIKVMLACINLQPFYASLIRGTGLRHSLEVPRGVIVTVLECKCLLDVSVQGGLVGLWMQNTYSLFYFSICIHSPTAMLCY